MNKLPEPIVVTQSFDQDISKVWNAITQLDEMKQWYFSNIPSFEATEGFETNFIVPSKNRIFPHYWKVTEVIPTKKIAYEWTFKGYSGKGLSEFELLDKGTSTQLNLIFTVLEKFPENVPEFKRESGLEGWNYLIKGTLKEYLHSKK
ncbi:SRPBCC domain-containing protein [Jejudonia soesokkakensis]|uniref:SRPBCC domain-containing protein n=1 Tax=Jejudonia soesokkakensis TaxID=1323432 RepID=A0ABW2MVJ9_9FLAO